MKKTQISGVCSATSNNENANTKAQTAQLQLSENSTLIIQTRNAEAKLELQPGKKYKITIEEV